MDRSPPVDARGSREVDLELLSERSIEDLARAWAEARAAAALARRAGNGDRVRELDRKADHLFDVIEVTRQRDGGDGGDGGLGRCAAQG